MRALYGEHPYAADPSGDEDSFKRLTRDDLLAFHKRYYVGSNAKAAHLSGIRVERLQILSFTIMGLIAGLAGIVYASRIATATATLARPLAADISFINLYLTKERLGFVRQELAYLSEHTPCCLVGDAQLPLELLGRYASASRGHKVHCVEPRFEGRRGLLKDGTSKGVNMGAASVAGISLAAYQLVMLRVGAVAANNPIWVYHVFDEG